MAEARPRRPCDARLARTPRGRCWSGCGRRRRRPAGRRDHRAPAARRPGLVFHTPLLIVVLVGGHGPRAVADPARARAADTAPRPTCPMAGPRRPAAGPRDGGRRPWPPRADLERLADEPWDLLVVGGGITGAGASSTRRAAGCKVALVERDDYAVGHLVAFVAADPRRAALPAAGRVGLVREALAERAGSSGWRPTSSASRRSCSRSTGGPASPEPSTTPGMTMYDLLGSARSGGRHRHLAVDGALRWAPLLRRERCAAAILYHDAMEDDARLILAVVRTAAGAGAPRGDPGARGARASRGGRIDRRNVRDELVRGHLRVRADRGARRDRGLGRAAGPAVRGAAGRPSASSPRRGAATCVVPRDRIPSPRRHDAAGSRAGSASSSRGRATG